MADEQEVRQLELLCKQLYESQDASQRAEAEKALVGFQNAPDTLSKCQLLLDREDSCYAQLLAATTLTKLVSRSAQGLSLQQRVDIRNYVLNYLATRPKLPNFVIQALVTLFARISKLGWFDSDKEEFVFRNVVTDIAKFLQINFYNVDFMPILYRGNFLQYFQIIQYDGHTVLLPFYYASEMQSLTKPLFLLVRNCRAYLHNWT